MEYSRESLLQLLRAQPPPASWPALSWSGMSGHVSWLRLRWALVPNVTGECKCQHYSGQILQIGRTINFDWIYSLEYVMTKWQDFAPYFINFFTAFWQFKKFNRCLNIWSSPGFPRPLNEGPSGSRQGTGSWRRLLTRQSRGQGRPPLYPARPGAASLHPSPPGSRLGMWRGHHKVISDPYQQLWIKL